MAEPRERLRATEEMLTQHGIPYKSWQENLSILANVKVRQDSVAIVILLPANDWSYDIDNLPRGCRSEMQEAKNADKEVYLSYQSSSGRKIYKIDNEEFKEYDSIEGVPQSTGTAISELKTLTRPPLESVVTPKNSVVAVDFSGASGEYKFSLRLIDRSYDERLLLLY